MENLGIASVAAITVITYLMGMAVRASRMDNKWIPILCGLLGGLLGGWLGGRLFKNIPMDWLRRGFGLLLLYGGIRSLFAL